MCLAVPMQVISTDGETLIAEIDGVKLPASLMMLGEEVAAGDFVLIHAGFAIARLDEGEALETLALMRECLERWPEP
jgi:hydrogenase expression/formation protein HypC